MAVNIHAAREAFIRCHAEAPVIIARAPGRVNIIGEHTDYNEGFVLPMALAQETVILARPRQDDVLNAYAEYFGLSAQARLDRPVRQPDAPWMDYLLGVAALLQQRGLPVDRGADVYIVSDLPVGAGVSSSAALEMAALCLFEALGDFRLEGSEAARLGQAVENEFLGLKTGIMDQFASRCCTAGHALFLDCRTLAYEQVPVHLHGYAFVVADTGSPRKLTSSKYNQRVAECGEAVKALRSNTGKDGTHLRDFTLEELESVRTRISALAYRRARHVISENLRTQEACAVLRAGNVERLGLLMDASHISLRSDYEVTSPELDTMYRLGRELGSAGSRMTGAGFGGCTLHLVRAEVAEAFGEELLAAYAAQTGLKGTILRSEPSEGAQILVS